MRIHHFHPDTGLYLGSGEADTSPLEAGVYLIPSHATTVAPPVDLIGSARYFVDGAWETRHTQTEPGLAQTFDELRQSKRTEIESAYREAIAPVTDGYTQEERDSWGKQEIEARGVLMNPDHATPLLSAIATARDMAVADLAAIVVAKAADYAAIAGAAFGRRRVLLAAIDAAETPGQIAAIAW